MSGALFLIPISIGMGLIGLAAFLWSLCHNQFDDFEGDAARMLTAPDYPANSKTKGEAGGHQDSEPHHAHNDRRGVVGANRLEVGGDGP